MYKTLLVFVTLLLILKNTATVENLQTEYSPSSFCVCPLPAECDDDFVFSQKSSDYWYEDCESIVPGKDGIHGPCVATCKGKSGFVWERAWSQSEEPEYRFNLVPYLVIFCDIDSSELNTALHAGPSGFYPAIQSYVVFQGPGLSGNFGHAFEWMEDDAGNKSVKEQMYFGTEGEEDKEYDLKNGRIFLIKKSATSDKYVVRQSSIELPERKTFDAFNTSSSSYKEKEYQRLEKWARENSLF